jgi:hypothetical protein
LKIILVLVQAGKRKKKECVDVYVPLLRVFLG